MASEMERNHFFVKSDKIRDLSMRAFNSYNNFYILKLSASTQHTSKQKGHEVKCETKQFFIELFTSSLSLQVEVT